MATPASFMNRRFSGGIRPSVANTRVIPTLGLRRYNPRHCGTDLWHSPRPVRNLGAARRWRHGRSVPRAGHAPGPRRRRQDPSIHLSDNVTLRQRFEQEAKAISSLNHPHICILHDVGHQDGIAFLVMEYLEGETLAKLLERGPLPLAQILKYGVEIADALDKAHRQGIVHRDLKPGNIMLTKSGAKLLDFGLAKAAVPLTTGATLTAGATRTTPVTQQGTIVGTFQYMSPEQIEGKELDGRSDIFSFGAVLYEMVTGRRAFQGNADQSTRVSSRERWASTSPA